VRAGRALPVTDVMRPHYGSFRMLDGALAPVAFTMYEVPSNQTISWRSKMSVVGVRHSSRQLAADSSNVEPARDASGPYPQEDTAYAAYAATEPPRARNKGKRP
jgi:hypothetical protein